MIQLEQGDLFGLSAAVSAAVDSGLFAYLTDSEARTAAELAASLSLNPVAVARVLDVIAAAGVVRVQGGAYTLAPELAAGHRAFPGGLALTAMLYASTPQYLRTGVAIGTMDGSNADRSEAYRATVGGLGRLFASAADAFATALPGSPGHILDVGCGSGIWSLAVAARHPAARITGLDLPAVLDVFAAEASPLGDRVTLLPGDMRDLPLPRADLVLLANVLRLEPAERAAALIARLAAAVEPGGRLVVVDALAGGAPEREVARAVYTLHLALRTRTAEVHAPSQVRAWFAEAGLVDVHPLDFGSWPGAVAAIVGRKR